MRILHDMVQARISAGVHFPQCQCADNAATEFHDYAGWIAMGRQLRKGAKSFPLDSKTLVFCRCQTALPTGRRGGSEPCPYTVPVPMLQAERTAVGYVATVGPTYSGPRKRRKSAPKPVATPARTESVIPSWLSVVFLGGNGSPSTHDLEITYGYLAPGSWSIFRSVTPFPQFNEADTGYECIRLDYYTVVIRKGNL